MDGMEGEEDDTPWECGTWTMVTSTVFGCYSGRLGWHWCFNGLFELTCAHPRALLTFWSHVTCLMHHDRYRPTSLLHSSTPYNFALPSITSFNNVNASTANRTIFATRSVPSSVFNSFTNVPRSQSTANATYPGVRFGVCPPVGPAVPLSDNVYVLSRSLRTCCASPDTMSVVGPL